MDDFGLELLNTVERAQAASQTQPTTYVEQR